MIDAQRNLNTTYRVDRQHHDGIHLKTFPPAPEVVAEGWYRMDQLPQWLIEAMALLDAAHPEGIPDLGHKVGNTTYWVEPPTRNTSGARISALLTKSTLNRSCEIIMSKTMDEANEAFREAERET